MTDISISKFVRGLSSQTFITIIMGVLSIITFSIFTRLLSQEEFGYFASLNAILVVFQTFSEAGLGSAVIQRKNCNKEYFSTAFTMSLIISCVLALLMFFSAGTLARLIADDTIQVPLQLVSVLLVLASIESVGRASLMRDLQFLKYGIFQIISYVLSYSLGIYMAYRGCGLYSLIVASILNSILTCILIFSLGIRVPRLFINKEYGKEIFSFGGWLTASVLVNQLTQQLDKLVLGKWLSIQALGAYSRPSSFITTITDKINGIFDTVLFPILSSIQDDIEGVKNIYVQSITLLNIFSAIMASAFYFNAELCIYIFFGHEWLNLAPVFRIISLGVVFMIDQRMVDCFFRSLGFVRQNFILRVICMLIMILFLYFGARQGVEVTAWCVFFASTISILVKMIYLSIKINVSIVGLAKSFLASFKPLLPILLIGIPYLLLFDTHSFIYSIIFFCLFCLIILLEFICFPGFVSDYYKKIADPYITRIKSRLF